MSLYNLTLNRGPRTKGGFQPPKIDLWPGDAGRGATIIDGDFELAGKIIFETNNPWCAVGSSARWKSRVSDFEWLNDLQALGTDNARERARYLIREWIRTDGRWNQISWRPNALGTRIANWIKHSDFILSGSEASFKSAFINSLQRQARHLNRVSKNTLPGAERVSALKGLILADLAIHQSKNQRKLQRKLVTEIKKQLLEDGCSHERNPSQQLNLLKDLIDIRAAYRSKNDLPPPELKSAIESMAPMLRFFRHGDGMLALFNGGTEGEDWLIDVVLERAEAPAKPTFSATSAGFERLVASRALVLMDTGKSPPPGPDLIAHAGALSFEFSIGKERLIVNCGAHLGDSRDWRLAQRTTAAHSTVSVENINSAEVLESGGFGNRPQQGSYQRQERDGQIWILAEHDGYKPTFGIIHRRRLHLDGTGSSLRGEDTLLGKGGRKFASRFHLHPSVRASLIKDGQAVLLRLPSGEGWRFQAKGGVINLQDSVYLGAGDRIKRTLQIVVSAGTNDRETLIKWMVARL
ncbi:MAG: heparinase II/III family protein [Pseudomonadota bacterium]|nr:heparinase II/III family protein [Pseudomonadota bacterium]